MFVIDSGKQKEKTYDAELKIACLLPAWVSRASAKQRQGRAGRVRPGVCWHLYPRAAHADLPEYQEPEVTRTPLEQVALQVRALGVAAAGTGGVERFLLKAPTPPSAKALATALSTLLRIGALDAASEALTPLGEQLSALPMEPRIGKALVYAALLGALDPVLTIV